ncbi:Iron-sulfur assembly protein 1 [Onygenales sp. PD_10]|nr:Iron-sulfur assembly protein 1 [Onygenales sp. PD_10]
MSFSSVQPAVTSSGLFRSVTAKLPRQTCLRCYRSFSSYTPLRHSSKRELQTATAYQPNTLQDSFPLPRNSGIPDTSIAGGASGISNKWQSSSFGRPQLPKRDGSDKKSDISLPEVEAQKSTPVAPSSPFTPSESSKSQTAPKPRRSRLKARKAAMSLTPEAVVHLRQLLDQPDPKLIRVGVKNRGCSGLAYNLEYVEKPAPFDEVIEQDGVKILIDSKALFSIIGSEMDWLEDKLSSRFVFRNPNIKDECGCGAYIGVIGADKPPE